jgi:hydroxyethylthiazole kinase-like uncharacterized protein yjeF
MKAVTPKQMSDLEAQAYAMGASEYDFMEEAGSGIALIVHDFIEKHGYNRQIIMLCGKGNNAGDAYVAGINLLHFDYEVIAYQLFPITLCSQLCQDRYLQFIDQGGSVKEVSSIEGCAFSNAGVIIDGIFGTGFHGSVNGVIAEIIDHANKSNLPIIAVDIPSGLNGETGSVESVGIVATITAFLGLPKIGFFLRDGWDYVGKLMLVDFGLPKSEMEKVQSDLIILSPDLMKPLMPKIKRSRHKYEAGHVIGLAGSIQMAGAAMLSCLSALCGGAGIVHLLHPDGMQVELIAGPYELLRLPYRQGEEDKILELMNNADALFLGPGMGLSTTAQLLLKKIIPYLKVPSVLDADALNAVAAGGILLPKEAVLTPHMGELKRLLHLNAVTLDWDLLHQCQAYVDQEQVILVLKGGPSFIFRPKLPILVNPRGDPGMATAGSGDVLTGLIASLLAQHLAAGDAAALGVYLHGIAGEFAASQLTSYCMTASDIIDYFPDAFQPDNWDIRTLL